MFAIRVEFLTGRYAATKFNDRDATEWPPHPARLFSALVAVWAQGENPTEDERDALLWLESQEPPAICATGASERSIVTFFVPNNEAGVAAYSQQQANFEKLTVLASELATVSASLVSQPSDGQLTKKVSKLAKELEKLQGKIASDSIKQTSAKGVPSPDAVSNGAQLLPEERGKQARTFPVRIPYEPVVHFVWADAAASSEQTLVLDSLLARVSRLGHSSSLVSCSVVHNAPKPSMVASRDGSELLRVPAQGLLDELERSFASHQGIEPRSLPTVFASYRPSKPPTTSHAHPELGDDWIVLTDVSDRKLPLRRVLDLTVAIRGALIKHADAPRSEILSGHEPGPEGQPTPPTRRDHLALVPLAFVGHSHADGLIRGVGLVLPRSADLDERAVVVDALRNWMSAGDNDEALVHLGRSGVQRMVLRDQLSSPATLQPQTWCRPSNHWISATPIVLDRFPGDLWKGSPGRVAAAERSAVETIMRSCEFAGLPRPSRVEIELSPPLVGVPAAGSFPIYESPGRKVRRPAVHARLWFDEPVAGPVLIGAGRFFGYGLCRPTNASAVVQGSSVPSEGES